MYKGLYTPTAFHVGKDHPTELTLCEGPHR